MEPVITQEMLMGSRSIEMEWIMDDNGLSRTFMMFFYFFWFAHGFF